MLLTFAVWTAVFLAAALLLALRSRGLGLGLLCVGYLLAVVDGLLDWLAAVPLVLLLATAYAYASGWYRLFLNGMIRHHRGAITMVEALLKNGNAGLDEAVFRFANDVVSD